MHSGKGGNKFDYSQFLSHFKKNNEKVLIMQTYVRIMMYTIFKKYLLMGEQL